MGHSNPMGTKSQLFWRASAIALITAAGWAPAAEAAENGAGGLWLELQGQYDFDASGASQSFNPSTGISDPTIHARRGYDVDGKLTYQSPGSPLSFAFGVRYGRTQSASRGFHATYATKYGNGDQTVKESYQLSHTVLDFEVGNDVGLGLFGHGVSTIGLGLRYAHFDAVTRGSFSTTTKYAGRAGSFRQSSKSDVVGPRIFLRTTSPLPGPMGQSGFSLGLGAGGGVLFGRQSARDDVHLSHGSYGQFLNFSRGGEHTVPTLDAYAQLSWRAPMSPLTISAGYRFDGYYNAIDAGYALPHPVNFIEHGPFIGLVWKLR
jgi:hypothetical protein